MKTALSLIAMCLLLAACGNSYEEAQKRTRENNERLAREDSAALKVAVLPTIDCLPAFVASATGLYEATGEDIRLKKFNAQMDIDVQLRKGRVELAATDMVRAEHLKAEGLPLTYLTATNLYWQLVTARKTRIRQLSDLNDKMIAMTRYSATHALAQIAVDSAKLKRDNVYLIQINDVDIRLRMLLCDEMTAALLPEPQATAARVSGNKVIMDSRKRFASLGAIVCAPGVEKDSTRTAAVAAFCKAYDKACDSINHYGLKHYAEIIKQYCNVDDRTIGALPADIKFVHIAAPDLKDLEKARKAL